MKDPRVDPEGARQDARLARWRSPILFSLLFGLSLTSWSGLLPFLSMHLIPATSLLMWLHTAVGLVSAAGLLCYLAPHIKRAQGQGHTPHYKLGFASLAVFVATAASAVPLVYGYTHVLIESAHSALSIAFVILIATHFAAVLRRVSRGTSVLNRLLYPLWLGFFGAIAVLFL
ncbi:MAG: hypothetical protein QY326_06950 [Bdellovibrionota bacterium]|nr:MAG: hypothetical protein QY326_06950 [Bdellovibrionota bacterium]